MTAVMQQTPTPTSFYDYDYVIKNQSTTRNLSAVQTNVTNANNNNASTQLSVLSVTQINNNNLNNNQSGPPSPSAATVAAIALQQQLNAAVAAQQAQVNHHHQQQQNHKMLLHNALQRAVSHPHNPTATSVVSLVNTLIENLGHRKLERTQSEPLPQVNTSRYKTELCRPFEEAGECKYGDKCQFAHGMHELRNLQRHPKYKTELCRTFHSVGFCPYGPRCHFVHNAEEARLHNRAVDAAYVRMAQQAAAQQAMQQQNRNRQNNNNNTNMKLPLSPPLSMSTGSDRASPTGSLSLSPTNSLASFFPNEQQISPTFPRGFSYPQSPPASPRDLSPVESPTPSSSSTSGVSGSSSSPSLLDDARLPVFNRLSSAIDAFNNLVI